MVQRLIIYTALFLTACSRAQIKNDDFGKLRRLMVENQIKARDIKDERVLAAMLKVPRHLFVPEKYRKLAYEDHPLPIGEGQTISQPYIVALMTEALKLQGHEKVLEIGTGSGYQAAILAHLTKEVYTIELLPALAKSAEAILKNLEYKNVFVRCGDGYLGWTEHAPFAAIIITCAPEQVPDSLIKQLAEGGRLVVPLGPEGQTQILTLYEKENGKLKKTEIAPVIFVPMKGLIEEKKH